MYHKCSKCGFYVDDRVMRDDKMMCEKCLYEEEKEQKQRELGPSKD